MYDRNINHLLKLSETLQPLSWTRKETTTYQGH